MLKTQTLAKCTKNFTLTIKERYYVVLECSWSSQVSSCSTETKVQVQTSIQASPCRTDETKSVI